MTKQTAQAESREEPPFEDLLKGVKLKTDPRQQAANVQWDSAEAGEKGEAQPSPDEKQVRLQAFSDRARKDVKEDALQNPAENLRLPLYPLSAIF
jgi:hypothetical protein